ncbi:hypothetical protein BCR32DRAFT_128131 [Anaeromyces robustus]|uniref:Uncharacterized protein n=1 Tax=Anaeromyces robustus TaxID=1754192 RepID=A0A1Y1XFE9_9FUNG|nr:hypothetical protein BCR32DRAFT_128131 [Anaeromyces robustus]|eukprot:ORX84443.1 hypothetical protein BCR32DRAFT_128131 [Anaeromyces robustus]
MNNTINPNNNNDNNNQKVIHLRNNKLILENKELREKVKMLNEKLAYHQANNSKSLEQLKKKLPPLKSSHDNSKCVDSAEYGKQKKYSDIFKLPTIRNKSTSIVEEKCQQLIERIIMLLIV